MQPFNIPKNSNQGPPKKPVNPLNRYPGPTTSQGNQSFSPPSNPINRPPMNMGYGLSLKSSEVHFEESPREPLSGGLLIQEDHYGPRSGNQIEHDESVNIGEMTEKGNDDEEQTEPREDKGAENLAHEINLKHSSEYRKGRYDQQHPEEDEEPGERSNRNTTDNNINVLERRSMPLGNIVNPQKDDTAGFSIRIQKLELELQKERNKNSILESEIQKLRQEATRVKTENIELTNQVQRLQQNQHTDSGKDEEIARLNLELKKVTNSYNSTKDHLNRILEQHKTYQEQTEALIAGLQEENYKLNRDIEQLRADSNNTFTATIETYREKERLFEQRLQAYDETIRSLQAEIQVKTEALTKIMSLRQDLQATSTELFSHPLKKVSDTAKSLQPRHEDSPSEPKNFNVKPLAPSHFHDTHKAPPRNPFHVVEQVHKQEPVKEDKIELSPEDNSKQAPQMEMQVEVQPQVQQEEPKTDEKPPMMMKPNPQEPKKTPSIEKQSDFFHPEEPPKQQLPTSLNVGDGTTMVLDNFISHHSEDEDKKDPSDNSEKPPTKTEPHKPQPHFNPPPFRGPNSLATNVPQYRMPPGHHNKPSHEPPRKPFIPGANIKTQESSKKEEIQASPEKQEEQKEPPAKVEPVVSETEHVEPPKVEVSEKQEEKQEKADQPPTQTVVEEQKPRFQPPPHRAPFNVPVKQPMKKNPFGEPVVKSNEIVSGDLAESFFDSLSKPSGNVTVSQQLKSNPLEEQNTREDPMRASNPDLGQDGPKVPPQIKKTVVKKALVPGNMFN